MLLVVCGPPGAGKTTIAAHLRERLRAAGLDCQVLHSDDFSRHTYDRMYDRVSETPDADWVVDGTFYRREWQERFRALPDAHLLYVTASLETCLARNRARENAIDERGVRVVYRQFDPPENPDLALDTDELSVENAVDALERYVRTWILPR